MNSKFLLTVFFALVLSAQTVWSQTVEELEAAIAAFDACFQEHSKPSPHEEVITLSNGKTVKTLAQSDFAKAAFVSVDQTLANVRAWKESPFMWRMTHRKDSKAILDNKDLTKWEIQRFDEIAEAYFKGNTSTFHIAAHGLLESDGTPADLIKMGGQELNASETAELILESMKAEMENGKAPYHAIINAKKQDFVIVVHSCHSAVGDNNFAQQLSVELSKHMDNVTVVGAPDTVFCSFDEQGQYQEYVSPERKIKSNNPPLKKWKAYKNGIDTGLGQLDYNQTVQSIQNHSNGRN